MSFHGAWKLRELIACKPKQARALLPLVDEFVRLAEKARLKGLNCLGEDLGSISDPLMALGVELSLDEIDPNDLRQILMMRIITGGRKRAGLLREIMILEGCLSLRALDNPKLLRERMLALLGPAGYSRLTSATLGGV